MQTLTFTQKLLRQRRFLSFLFPLFAVFVGLGASQTAQAQVTITSTNVFIQRNGAATETFNVRPGAPMPFDGANLGSYDINTGQLVLKGGSVTTNETGTTRAVGAQLNYSVFDFNFNLLTSGFVTLQGGAASNGNRTFSNSTQNIDLVSISRPAGAGTPYYLAVDFSTTQAVGFTTSPGPVDNNGGMRYAATYSITGATVAPTNVGNSNVFINTTGTTTPNTTYGASSTATPRFQGANLGTYDINTGKLTLNGGNATTFESNGDAVQTASLTYRIIKPVQPGTPTTIVFPVSTISLTQVGMPTSGNGGVSRLFQNTTALRNLISGLANSGTGTFNISVSFEADVLRNGQIVTIRDDNGGSGYTATFTTTGTPILTNTWQGDVSNDWFTAANWDLNRVPDFMTNVVIPDYGVGSTNIAPDIFAGVSFTASNGQVINNTNSGFAQARNIDMQGSTQAQRSIMRLRAGRLQVFGGFKNSFDSYIQDLNTITEFAGAGNQTITGGSFTAVELSGGGTKNMTGVMRVSISMTFKPNAGLFTTDISIPADSYLELGGRATSAPDGAQLIGETDVTTIPSYVRGFVRTTRFDVRANEVDANGQPDPRSFGNIGMTLLFTGADPGDVLVTRNTAESYTPLVANSTGTSTERYGIRRIFGVRPNFRTGVVANMGFRYLDTELTNLGPKGDGSVSEPNLALFLSTSGGNQFGFLGVDALDQVNNILTKNGVRTFATFTLGDRTRPLPVSLTGFDVKRIGADALVTWQTASEQNNKGFNVQVSADGKTYRTVGFVASETPNSTSPKAYTFTDTEKNKGGARYYRLEQLDVDGKSTFFAPRVVTFDGKATEANSGIVAYPNPLNNEILHLSLNSSVSGTGVVRVLDMTGRQVAQRNLAITIGSNDVAIENMSELKSGLYILNVMLPSGEKKTMKVVKQ